MFCQITHSNGVSVLVSSVIPATHGFTTRQGGVSTGIYESLNLGTNRGDDEVHVRENYQRLKDALSISGGFVFSKQVHGTVVREAVPADAKEPYESVEYECDALMTDVPELPLIIFIADCVPVLLYDPILKVAAAAHAGWRGTVGDIVGKTVNAMSERYGCEPRNICGAIGPSICQSCFETDAEVPDAVRDVLGDAAEPFITDGYTEGKYHVDLKGVNRELLIRAGLDTRNIDVTSDCTRCMNEKYWSHRYTGGNRGSQAAVIMVRGS